jgi:DNA processing protein
VEAAEGSGALITAGAALEQGRDVLAVPGPITLATSYGVNGLLRDGAAPFLVAKDLWDRLPAGARPSGGTHPRLGLPADLAPTERRVAELLQHEVLGPDELGLRLGLAAGDVLALVTALELRGVVESLPGPRYRARPR